MRNAPKEPRQLILTMNKSQLNLLFSVLTKIVNLSGLFIPLSLSLILSHAYCVEFWLLYFGRPHNMGLIFAEELFPSPLSPKERAMHWVEFFSYFKSQHVKALHAIFSQKRR